MLQAIAIGGALLLSLAPFEARAQDADLDQRIFNLGILRTGKSSSKSGKKRTDPKVVLAQVQEDFTKLQVTNNELAEANEKSQPLDIDFVVKAISEIQTRADRLMENLTESKPMKNQAQSIPSSREQLKSLITKLDNVVGEFAHNPVFKEASPDDEKLAKKALQDLDQIIQLASEISKGAENLKKQSP
jgi:hypothetical protein